MAADDVYLVWSFPGSTDAEVLVAELADLGFDGFEDREDGLRACVPERLATGSMRNALSGLQMRLGVAVGEPERIEAQNWNQTWESRIEPVVAGPFVVHPPWHDPPSGALAIRIEPKMSFGTGHHESTRLLLGLLPDLVRPGDRVLDAGTGTGVLAIGAVLLGASGAVGFDIDPWSARNARENVEANGLAGRVTLVEGELEDASEGEVDLILANINRNVLLDLVEAFARRLPEGGRLGLAGILLGDRTDMVSALVKAGFRLTGERREGEWLALAAERR